MLCFARHSSKIRCTDSRTVIPRMAQIFSAGDLNSTHHFSIEVEGNIRLQTANHAGAASVVSAWCNDFKFYALRELQLAQTVSILFCSPFVVTILSVVLLNEKVGLHRWASIAAGFCGVLIIFRPGIADLPVEVIYSIITMLCYSGYTLTTRILAPIESSTSLVCFPALFVSVIMIPFAIPNAAMPEFTVIIVILLAGILGTLGHWFHTRAHALAQASTLAPYMYIEIIWMIVLGYLVFSDVPDIYTIIGASIISASGLYLLYRERQIKN